MNGIDDHFPLVQSKTRRQSGVFIKKRARQCVLLMFAMVSLIGNTYSNALSRDYQQAKEMPMTGVFYLQNEGINQYLSASGIAAYYVSDISVETDEALSKWQVSRHGDYYHLKNVASGYYLRPNNTQDQSSLQLVANTIGSEIWAQWAIRSVGKGFEIINRRTGYSLQAKVTGDDVVVPSGSLADANNESYLFLTAEEKVTRLPVVVTSSDAAPEEHTPSSINKSPVAPFYDELNSRVHSSVSNKTLSENSPEYTLDGNISTRWQSPESNSWIEYDLGAVVTLDHIQIAFFDGEGYVSKFEIQLSNNGMYWNTTLESSSQLGAVGLQRIDIPVSAARFVRIVGLGDGNDNMVALSEVVFDTISESEGVYTAKSGL